MKQTKNSTQYIVNPPAINNIKRWRAGSKQILLLLVFPIAIGSLLSTFSFSQNIAINTTGNAANVSALLDIDASPGNNKGLLLPRMTTAERNAITAPIPESLLIYNTTTQCFEAWNQATLTWVAWGCIGCQLPGAFTATAASGITTTSFSANWSASATASAYFLDVSTVSNFATYVTGYNNLNVGNVTTYSVNTNLTCATTYYYRLRANNACGTNANSNAITVTTSACFTCGSALTDSRDGKTYSTVLIGSQCWMAQNLNYGTYVAVVSGGQVGAGTQKYCQNLSGVNDNTCPFGGLYEWNEMMNGSVGCNGTGAGQPGCTTPVQGICPAGWHIPSHYEWTLLERTICTSGTCATDFPYDVTTINLRGTNEGGKMKVTPICGTLPCWNTPNTGATNSSGFTALPGGYSWAGTFYAKGIGGWWWSATDSGANAWFRRLSNPDAFVERNNMNNAFGLNVRCVKD